MQGILFNYKEEVFDTVNEVVIYLHLIIKFKLCQMTYIKCIQGIQVWFHIAIWLGGCWNIFWMSDHFFVI